MAQNDRDHHFYSSLTRLGRAMPDRLDITIIARIEDALRDPAAWLDH